jgi:adenylate kinase family enzyme
MPRASGAEPRTVVARRVLLIGPTGSGKTTVAAVLSRRSGLGRIELDRLLLGPDWSRLPQEEFRARIAECIVGGWIIDGNYAGVRDMLWSRADVVVWLDLPIHAVLLRLIPRTLVRLVRREDLGGGNREGVGRLLSRQSILWWAVRSHRDLRQEYERAVQVYGERVPVVRLTSAAAQRQWLAWVRKASPDETLPGSREALVCPLS